MGANDFAPFYSYKNALGIVMGAGNVGSELGNDVKASKTYVSRDAGLTWQVAADGNYIYEYGNLGGLLVMADMVNPTTVVQYSGDEGRTWDRFSFAPEPMIVNNVLIESDAKSQKFIAYGTNPKGKDGILYHIDFSAVQTRQCQGVLNPDTDGSDYETWTPSDGGKEQRCLLGKTVMYTRRKQKQKCFNNEADTRKTFQKTCKCTESNYECELGFMRRIGDMKCQIDDEEDLLQLIPTGCVAPQIHQQVGYRKVAGDECKDGFTPPLVELHCPAAPSLPGYSGTLIRIFVLVMLLAVFAYFGINHMSSGKLNVLVGGWLRGGYNTVAPGRGGTREMSQIRRTGVGAYEAPSTDA